MDAVGEDRISLRLDQTRPIGDVQWGCINVHDLPMMDFSGADIQRYSVRSGDLLVCEGGEVGRAAIWSGQLAECFYQKALHRLRALSNQENPHFLFYLLSAAASLEVFGGTKATIAHLPAEAFRKYRFSFPSQAEQNAIAAFLDHETAKIDMLVEAQRRLIELLKEKRQAVISHAVTKGLDSSAPMKDSGVEWLGEVPAHWTKMRLKGLSASFCDGPFGSGLKSEHYVDDGVRVVRLQNIKANAFDGSDAAFIDTGYFEKELARHDVQPGDVLLAGLGDERNIVGRSCVAPDDIGPAMVKADCFRFRLQASANPYFVSNQLSAGATFAAGMMSSGSTRSRIPLSVMADRIVTLPGTEEQAHIVQHIGALTAQIEILAEQAGRSIALLSERRAGLISAAVTGKIDVRGLAAVSEEAQAA